MIKVIGIVFCNSMMHIDVLLALVGAYLTRLDQEHLLSLVFVPSVLINRFLLEVLVIHSLLVYDLLAGPRLNLLLSLKSNLTLLICSLNLELLNPPLGIIHIFLATHCLFLKALSFLLSLLFFLHKHLFLLLVFNLPVSCDLVLDTLLPLEL